MPLLLIQSMISLTSAMTSGPMPSPGSRSSFCVGIFRKLVADVMAGLVPAIHVFASRQDVDARPEAGHDEENRGIARAPKDAWQAPCGRPTRPSCRTAPVLNCR